MSVNQVPTLVLGIGGIGCKIAAEISELISPEDRKYIGIVGMDTNVSDLTKLREKYKMEIIQTSDDRRVDAYLEKHPEYCDWFPVNDFLRKHNMTQGAGQIRTLSRLACLAAEEAGRFGPIASEITRIRKVDSNPLNKSLAIVIVGSITGGTGAGLFLHMPYYLRNLLKTQVGLENTVIRGMFVGPDIMEDVQPSQKNKDAVCVNAYTCLKELNSFYLRPIVVSNPNDNNLRLDFYDHKDTSPENIPYNYLYLIEKSNNLGAMGTVRVGEVISYAAQILYTLMFSPTVGDTLSIEDNFIMSVIGRGGMNRFTGAGMCKLTYPIESAQTYVTLKVVQDLVQKEWLHVDQEYEAMAKAARMQKKTDGTTEIPKIQYSYVSIFDELVKGEGASLGSLMSEAYVKVEQEYVPQSNSFIATFENMIKDYLASNEVTSKEEDCCIDRQKMKKFSDAESEISRIWEAMYTYTAFAKEVVKTLPMSYANELFPVTKEVMSFKKNSTKCIYQLLSNVHPVTARFFIYSLINYFEELIGKLKIRLNNVNLSTFKDEDFDPKEKDTQGPTTALENIKKARNPLWKILGPVGEAINSEEKAMRKLRTKLEQVADTHVKITHNFLSDTLKLSVAKIMLERLTELADDYTIFFSTVAEKIERNNENITSLENISFSFGLDGVYCTKEAYRKMAEEYIATQKVELSGETKTAIFEEIFSVLARKFSASNLSDSKADTQRRIQEAKTALDHVFNKAVVDTIHLDVVKHGGGIVNLTAREAMFKEFELSTGLIETDPNYRNEAEDYIKQRISDALKIATPMLATDKNDAGTEIVFVALNPQCAEKDDGLHPDNNRTAHFYLKTVDNHSIVIIDESFKDTDITCLRLTYDFTLEELTKYKDGTRNELAYSQRISDLRKQPEKIDYHSSDISVVVNPHLDCYWHEEGFIQAIQIAKREKDHEDHLKAFIYGLGMDKFKLIDDDAHPDDEGRPRPTWFAYIAGTMNLVPIKKCGKLIGNSFSELYDSILYNGGLKQDVLRDAALVTEVIKGYRSTDQLFEEILENAFVEDLIENESDKTQSKDINIFDIFLEMKSYMPVEKWNELFDGLLITLWEFCETLFDKSERHINMAVTSILKAIYENSVVGKKALGEDPNVTLTFDESMLQAQYDILLKKKYTN